MASKIKHSFKEGCLALIKGGWANRVARFCSYWCGVNGIDVLVPETPSPNAPVKVGLNIANATKLIVNEMTGNLGISFESTAHPLQMKLVTKTQGNAQVADYAAVYLPTLTIRIKGTNYTVTGVTAIENGGGWYKINSRTTGNFYLNQSGSTTNLVWATSALADTEKASYFVGQINYSSASGYSVVQYCRPMCGQAVAQDEGGSGGGELPADNLTGTLVNGRLVKGTGSYTATSSVFAPPDNHQLVVAPENMTGNANCLPMVTQNASITQSASLANSGIAVIDMTTKNAIKGENVKIDANGATIQEWDNVAVASDGTLKLDQTDYAWFDPDEDTIIDEGIVVANGTDGKIKTLEKLSSSKVKIDEEGTTLEDLINAETSKIADDALDLFEEEGGEFYIDFDNTAAYVGDGNALVGTSEDGLIQEACDIPQSPATDKVLMVKAGQTTPSFEDFAGGESAPQTLQVKLVTKTVSGSPAIDYLAVYLPQLTMPMYDGTYTFRQGSTTGYVSSVGGGWYKVNGITTGNLYIVDDSYLNGTTFIRMVKFATAALSDTKKFSGRVANVSFSAGTATIIQGGTPMFLDACPSLAPKQERPNKANNNLKVWHSSTGSDTASSMTSTYKRDTQTWERGVTQTLTVAADNATPTTTSTEFCGVRMMVVTRIERQGDEDVFYWRYAYFDKNGCLYKLDAESDNCFVEKNSQY